MFSQVARKSGGAELALYLKRPTCSFSGGHRSLERSLLMLLALFIAPLTSACDDEQERDCNCRMDDYMKAHQSKDSIDCGTIDQADESDPANEDALECISSALKEGVAFIAVVHHQGFDSFVETGLMMTDAQVMYLLYYDSNVCGGYEESCEQGCGPELYVSRCDGPRVFADGYHVISCADERDHLTCSPERQVFNWSQVRATFL